MKIQEIPKSASQPNEIELLLDKARQGDSQAAQDLFTRYSAHFRTVIRQKLGQRLRSLFDSDDFLQEARREMFVKKTQELCATVPHFLHLLESVVKKRVLDANRKHLDYQEQNLRRQVPLHRISEEEESSASQLDAAESLMIAEEQWELLQRVCPEHKRPILEMLRQGFTHHEIATKLQISEKSVQRFLVRLRKVVQIL